MSEKILGIHFAPGALKLVELEEQAQQLRVVAYALEYFPKESKLAERLKSALQQNKIRAKAARLVVSSGEIVYKLLELPALPAREIAAAIRYKLKAALPPNYKNFLLDYYQIKKEATAGQQLYFAAAIPEENIVKLLQTAGAAGLTVKDVLAPASALANVLGEARGSPCAAINIGIYSSLIILVKNNQAVFAREVEIGGDDITRAMVGAVQTGQGRIELDYQRAEEIKRRYGLPVDLEKYSQEAGLPGAELLALMRPALEKISAEIQNTFDFYRQQTSDPAEFEKIYFTGGSAKTKNLLVYFKSQLNRETAALAIKLPCQRPGFTEDAASLSLAIGAAISGKEQLSLLPKKKSELPELIWQQLRKQARLALTVGLILALLLALQTWLYSQQKNLTVTQQRLQQQLAAVQKIETENGLVPYGQSDRFAAIMQLFDQIIPGEIFLLGLDYQNKSNELQINGLVLENQGKRKLAALIEELKKNRVFSAVDLIYLEETDAYSLPAYRFQLKCLLTGGAQK